MVARKDGGVDPNNLATFKGKSIAAQAGGQTFKLASQLNAQGNLGITIVPAKDTGETFLMVESGRVAHDERRRPGLWLGGLVQDPTPS